MRAIQWGICFSLILAPTSLFAAVTPDAPTNFITTWNTENPGTSANNQITIPGTGVGYNYEIYWENTASSTQNGTTSLITASSYTLTFPEPGIYEVQASGTFPRIRFGNGGDRQKILTVEQWGNIAWTSMESAFYGANNLRVPATDAPDLSGVTSMRSMFRNAAAFNDPVNHWDVSNVQDMQSVFRLTPSFNQPLNDWDVSNVTNMRTMFYTFNGSSFAGMCQM
jgi:surface protein